jgi:hypothetical protein
VQLVTLLGLKMCWIVNLFISISLNVLFVNRKCENGVDYKRNMALLGLAAIFVI